jgi:hypothetical protein
MWKCPECACDDENVSATIEKHYSGKECREVRKGRLLRDAEAATRALKEFEGESGIEAAKLEP